MRKLVAAMMVIVGFTTVAYAQKDAKAKAILAEVTKKYKSYKYIKTDFSFTLNNAKANVRETQQGTLYVKVNSNEYKVAMTSQELYSDGKTQWTYLKRDKEVQVSNVDNNSDAINPAKIFTVYESGFKYVYTGEKKVGGKTLQMIDLTPIDTKKSIFKVRLAIDKAKKQIASAELFDKNGNTYTYHVKSFVPSSSISESTFTYNAKDHPGVEVVDLR